MYCNLAGEKPASVLRRPRNRQPEFRVLNAAGRPPQLLIYDDIGPAWLGMIDDQLIVDELEQIGDVDEIHVRINSPGGDVFMGLGIYNALKNHPARIVAFIDGLAGSTAGWIPMAADQIHIAENAFLMIHRVSAMAFGTPDELRNTADSAEQVEGSIVGMFASRTGQTTEQLTEWMAEETWMNGPTAVERKFADVLEANKAMPANSALLNCLIPGRFKQVPEALRNRLAEASPESKHRQPAAANLSRQRELELLELELAG